MDSSNNLSSAKELTLSWLNIINRVFGVSKLNPLLLTRTSHKGSGQRKGNCHDHTASFLERNLDALNF